MHWSRLLITPSSTPPASRKNTFFLTGCPLFCFHVYGIRWFAECSTPRRVCPVRSAEKTKPAHHPAAPSFWELQAGATVTPGHTPPPPPSTPPVPPASLLLPFHPCSSLSLAQTVVYQHRPEHSAASRNTHGDGTATHTLPSTHSHALFAAVKALLTHTFSPAPASTAVPGCQEPGPSSRTTHMFSVGFSQCACVLMAEAYTREPGQYTLFPPTWAGDLPLATV